MDILQTLRPGQRFTGKMLRDMFVQVGRPPVGGRGMRVESVGLGMHSVHNTRRRIVSKGKPGFLIFQVVAASNAFNAVYNIEDGAGLILENIVPQSRPIDPDLVDMVAADMGTLAIVFPLPTSGVDPLAQPPGSFGGCVRDSVCFHASGASCQGVGDHFLGAGSPCVHTDLREAIRVAPCPESPASSPNPLPPPPLIESRVVG